MRLSLQSTCMIMTTTAIRKHLLFNILGRSPTGYAGCEVREDVRVHLLLTQKIVEETPATQNEGCYPWITCGLFNRYFNKVNNVDNIYTHGRMQP